MADMNFGYGFDVAKELNNSLQSLNDSGSP